MKTPLDFLIAHYKKEKKFLEKEIRDCLRYEKDYYTANLLQRGLGECEENLRILEDIQNPYTQELTSLKTVFDEYTSAKLSNLEGNDFRFGNTHYSINDWNNIPPEIAELRKKHLLFYDKRIEDVTKKIENLKNSALNPSNNQHNTISNYIGWLLEKEFKSLTLFQPTQLSKYIEINHIKDSIQIKLIYSSNEQNPFFIDEWHVENIIEKGYHKPNSKPILIKSLAQNHCILKPIILKDLIDIIKLLKYNRNLDNNFLVKVS